MHGANKKKEHALTQRLETEEILISKDHGQLCPPILWVGGQLEGSCYPPFSAASHVTLGPESLAHARDSC